MALQYMFDAVSVTFQPVNLLVLAVSVAAGLVMGALPGLSATMAIALLTGLTYNFDTQSAMIALLGVYVGSISGGCQSAILLNIPGTAASAATAMDGFPIAKRGEGGKAIFLATLSSCLGTMLSVVFVLTLTPLLTSFALKFKSWEFFLLSIFGILICGALTAQGNAVKGWISGILGLLVAQIGLDTVDTFARFSYGNVNVMSGIQLIPVMIGLFGFPEIVKAFKRTGKEEALELTSMKASEGFRLVFSNWAAVIRSSFIGVGVGIIPGVGEDVGGWLSYWASKTRSKDPESFGKGNPVGVISAETGNNACIGGAIIPLLTLAVPGSPPAAVLLGALYLHNIRPGPMIHLEFPRLPYHMTAVIILASFALFAGGLLLTSVMVHVLKIKPAILMPIVSALSVIGAFAIGARHFDLYIMLIFGFGGFALNAMGFPPAPLILGMILGPLADGNFRRTLLASDGSLAPFFTRPISLLFVALIALTMASQFGVFAKLLGRKAGEPLVDTEREVEKE